MSTLLGEIEINLYAGVEAGDIQHIGSIAVPVAGGKVVRSETGVSVPINVDRAKFIARLHQFVDELGEQIHQDLTGN